MSELLAVSVTDSVAADDIPVQSPLAIDSFPGNKISARCRGHAQVVRSLNIELISTNFGRRMVVAINIHRSEPAADDAAHEKAFEEGTDLHLPDERWSTIRQEARILGQEKSVRAG